MKVMTPKFGLGACVLCEDDAVVRGAGRYADGEAAEGVLHAVVVRSPHAQACLVVGDLSAIRETPGVRLVLRREDRLSSWRRP